MTEPGNPYQSPESPASPPSLDAMVPRPVTPKVFGILGLIFGILGILGSLVGAVLMRVLPNQGEIYGAIGYSGGYQTVTTVLGVVGAFVLIAASIGLLRYRDFGRLLFIAYAVYTILFTLANSGYLVFTAMRNLGSDLPPEVAGATVGGVVGGAVGGLVGLIFPVLGLILLNRRAVRASLS